MTRDEAIDLLEGILEPYHIYYHWPEGGAFIGIESIKGILELIRGEEKLWTEPDPHADPRMEDTLVCSGCGYPVWKQRAERYCPFCGSRMKVKPTWKPVISEKEDAT